MTQPEFYWGGKGAKKKNDPKVDIKVPNNQVDMVNNRIYYYSGVDEDSVLALNKHVQSLIVKAKVHSVHNEMALENSGQIFLHLQSFGGSVFSGLSAMDTLLEAKESRPVTTLVDGCAASAATFMSIVGTRRLMRRSSYMLIHQLSSGMWGQYEDLKDEMQNLDLFMDTIRNMYGKYTKVPKKEIDKILKKDMWWDAEKCLKYGLVDEII